MSLEKTEVLFETAPSTITTEPNIIYGIELKIVSQFINLGNTISRVSSLNQEMSNKHERQTGRWRLFSIGYTHHQLVNKTDDIKCSGDSSLFKMDVKYGQITTHTLYNLKHFHMYCFCSILKVHWRDKNLKNNILERAKTTSIEATIIKD